MMILSLLSPIVMAQETPSRAEELFYNGQQLFEDNEYKSAILSWEKGYKISSKPDFLKNIAMAQEALGQYNDAILSLNQYRALASFDDQAKLKIWFDDLKQKQAQTEAEAEEKAQIKEAVFATAKEQEEQLQYDNAIQTLKQYILYASPGDRMEVSIMLGKLEQKRQSEQQKFEYEQELASLQEQQAFALKNQSKVSSTLKIWTPIAVTAIASSATVYFGIKANEERAYISGYCDWDTSICLENAGLSDSFEGYSTLRRNTFISSGVALGFASIAVWQVSANLSVSPTSVLWSTKW